MKDISSTGKGNLLLSVLSGILLALSFPPLPFNMLAFTALVPLLLLFERQPKHYFLHTYITFFIFSAGSNWWISSWQPDTDPFLFASGILIALFHPFFFFIPTYFYRYIKRKFNLAVALFTFPVIWTSFEWLHSLGDLGYPWLTVGYTQIYNKYWIQFVDLTGVWGASFLIIASNVLIVATILLLQEQKNTKWLNFLVSWKFARLIVPLLLLFILPTLYGSMRINSLKHSDLMQNNPTISIGLIQPNINPWRKWDSNGFEQIAYYRNIGDSLRQAAGKFDLEIWTETSITYLNPEVNIFHNFGFLRDHYDTTAALLTGFSDIMLYKNKADVSKNARQWKGTDKYYESYNSVLMLNPNHTDTLEYDIYHKIRLTPFGERFPFAEVFTFALQWFEWKVGISNWSRGKLQKNLIFRNDSLTATIAPVICIESIFPGFVRNFTNEGAELITIITNDGWYDFTPGPEQHYLIAAMRAIENRRYIARCANTGVTGFISPTGETIKRVKEYTAVGTTERIPLLKEKTFFVEAGEYLPIACTIVSGLFFFVGFFFRRKAL